MDSLKGQQRIDKMTELRKKLQLQQFSFVEQTVESETSLRASYIIAEKFAKNFKLFSEGELI